MNLRKIIIFQHEVLFNVLNEINEILNFNLIKIDELSKEDIEKYSELDTLVISKSEKVQFKNLLVVEEKPIKIENIFKNRPYNPDRNYRTKLNLVASMVILLYELLKS